MTDWEPMRAPTPPAAGGPPTLPRPRGQGKAAPDGPARARAKPAARTAVPAVPAGTTGAAGTAGAAGPDGTAGTAVPAGAAGPAGPAAARILRRGQRTRRL